jgi:hypothetical protein
MMVMAGGMALVIPSMTGSIMSAVPLGKAGVGSAMNDTTRELGGALGIAILGSIANAAYRGAIELGGLGLGGVPRAQAEDSIGTAARVAAGLPGGGVVKARAADAFTHAFNVTSVVSIGIVAVAAAAVLFFSRSRSADSYDEVVELDDAPTELELALVPVGAGERSE